MSNPSPKYVADFDSASAMMTSLGRFLNGRDFPALGNPLYHPLRPVAGAINAIPKGLRERIYTFTGATEGIPPERAGTVDGQAMARWVTQSYPRRPYPAVAVGSSCGALVHLCAALGIPWLPQTMLTPIKRPGLGSDEAVDDLVADMNWAKAPARAVLDANPDLILHHMHDPVQDRLMIRQMTYFRLKRRTLGEAYERFITDTLPPGGTILLVECDLSWPTVHVGDRHYFQSGAYGGPTADEYVHGSPRVAEFLKSYGSERKSFHSPEPDGNSPEAEWGFQPELRDDVLRLARDRGYKVKRLTFSDPGDLSPPVADLYRQWHRSRRLPANRLLVEQFAIQEPTWTLRTGSVPYWTAFPIHAAAEQLRAYLDGTEAFDEINLMLFSHGTVSIDLEPIEGWREILSRAKRKGQFIGVDPDEYPRDFATFIRYYPDLKKKIAARYPLPGPLTLRQVDEFFANAGDRYATRYAEVPI